MEWKIETGKNRLVDAKNPNWFGRFLATSKPKVTSLACMTCCLRLTGVLTRIFTMIDTIILSIPKPKTMTLDMTARGVAKWDLQARGKGYEKYVKNPSDKDIESGLSFPRLTGYNRNNVNMLKIEFSAPKLIYKNNIDELNDSQFEDVVEALRDRLDRMGVVIKKENLISADVQSVHYSKNIELTNGYTSQYVIGELGKINLNKRFDLTKARYMNDGQSLCAYCISHSFILYDKVADLKRSKKKSMDRDQTPYQLNLFEQLSKKEASREILRFEVRLSQKRKMDSMFKKLGFADNPTFKDVFSMAKSRAVLKHYWDTMIDGNSALLFAHSLTAKDLARRILLAHRKSKAKEIIYRTGLLLLSKDGNGLRELRTMLSTRANDQTWYRLIANAQETAGRLDALKPREWYDQLKMALESYPLLRLDM